MKKICLLVLMLFPSLAFAEGWVLDGAKSEITAVSIKKGTVGEVHHFKTIVGQSDGSRATVTINLASIESGIGIRNERMKSMLFEVEKFASATITADTAKVHPEALKAGEAISVTMPVSLDLHGFRKELNADVTVVSLTDGLLVTSRSPILIKASDFGLDGGIEALRKVANLPAIAQSIPVSFELYFKRKH